MQGPAGIRFGAGARRRLRLAFSVLAAAALSCNLPAGGPALGTGASNESSGLELDAHAIRLKPGEITYSVRLTNRGAENLGGVSLELNIPAGATVQEVFSTPLSGEMQQVAGQVTWKIPALGAGLLAGPFAVRVGLVGEPAPSAATARWQTPLPGETSAPFNSIEDATQASSSTGMAAGSLGNVPGLGIGYFVPFGNRGQVSLAPLDLDPPEGTAAGLTWLSAYQVDKQNPGSVVLIVPLRRPARPFLVVRVFVDSGQGIHEQAGMGTVTADGLHAVFAADGSSSYFLGVDEGKLNAATADIRRGKTETLVNAAADAARFGDDVVSLVDTIGDLVNSLRTDAIWIEDTGEGWVVFDTDPKGFDSGCESDAAHLTCSLGVDSGGFCNGHGGGVVDYGSGGSSTWYCADGSVTYCSESGRCQDNSGSRTAAAETSAAGTATADAGGNIFPEGPCPVGFCLFDTQTGEIFAYSDMLLTDSLMGMLDLLNGTWSVDGRLNFNAPPSAVQNVQTQGGATDARGMRSVIGLAGTRLVFLIPGGQRWKSMVGPPAVSEAAGTPPPNTPTQESTLTATAFIVVLPTETFTPAPPVDGEGPGIKNVTASPNPINAGTPKGCKATLSIVSASIIDPSEVQSASVNYKGIASGSVLMSPAGGNTWQATLGPFDKAGSIQLRVLASDNLGNSSQSQPLGLAVNACNP